ncbi:MAG: transposase, partial [Firmicutes bacterium]|nr:transposase [Bacillota bacterium]
MRDYEDKYKWHNQFREQATQRIDEDLFRPLFCEDFGAPNASIRVLIGMMVLKEAHGWSDSQLFEHCKYNLLVRSALGFMNIDDPVPASSTYYLLRRRIVSWEKEGHGNLIEKMFAQATKSQAIEFQIYGNKIRMDSKLLGSNIAWYNRYELV